METAPVTATTEPQELLAVKVYVPATAGVTPVSVGFCNVEAKLFGPVQLQLVAPDVESSRENELPSQTKYGLATAPPLKAGPTATAAV